MKFQTYDLTGGADDAHPDPALGLVHWVGVHPCSSACTAMSKKTKAGRLGDLPVDVHLVTCLAFKHWALFSGYQSNAPF